MSSAKQGLPPVDSGYVVGLRVLVDGRDPAIVRAFFPRGSTSFAFPHYKLDIVGGDRNVAVCARRVGITRRAS